MSDEVERTSDGRYIVVGGRRWRAWWEEPTPAERRQRIEAALLTLAHHRGLDGVAPDDAARVVGSPHWERWIDLVEDVAAGLSEAGPIESVELGERRRFRLRAAVDPN